MKIEPMGSRLIVRRDEQEKIGMIYVPEAVKKSSLVGEVIETGSDCYFVEVGDMIVFARYSGYEIPMKDDKYKKCLVMNEEDILGKLKGEPNGK